LTAQHDYVLVLFMSEQDDAMRCLGELCEFGMAAVRRIAAAIEAADDTPTLIALVEAHCKVGRGVRQSIALRLRIASGSFAAPYAAPSAEAHADAESEERDERGDRPERADWNEYERPDWETPVRLDAEHFEADVQAAVVRIRRDFDKGLAVLEPPPRRLGRAALLTGSAALRLVDSS
jgi:hypothetical protein